jgi:hypothetical protein
LLSIEIHYCFSAKEKKIPSELVIISPLEIIFLAFGQVWWYKPVIPALGRLRQRFTSSRPAWGYIVNLRSA